MRAKIIKLIVGITFLLGATQCRQKEDRKPNIVFFLVDDLGWKDVGCYGSSFYETPNIDNLASRGVRFTDAYAACSVCSPTRASILTGKYPATLNLTDWLPGRKDFPFQKLKNVEISQHLPYNETTLAEVLKENGYSTAMIGKWHLGDDPSGPKAHGFDIQIPAGWNKGWPLTYYAPFGLANFDGEEGEYLTDRLTDEALKYIEGNKEKPFFLYLSHFAVHDPIEGPENLVEKYTKKLASTVPDPGPPFILEGNPDDTYPLAIGERTSLLNDEAYSGYGILPRNTVKIKQRQDNVRFAGMVESMDRSLGKVLSKLKELNLVENTIVIFFSDNGGMAAANYYDPERQISEVELDEAFSTSNLPLRGAKGWLYEGGIRVPLIIKWPKKGEQNVISRFPVVSVDLFPTILEMIGIQPNASQSFDGKSIVPLVEGADSLERKAIYWHFPHYSNHGMISPGGAVRYGDYKLIEYYENNTVQLFNLKVDIAEENDLSESEPEIVEKLRAMLYDWRKSVSAKMMEPNPHFVSGDVNELYSIE